MHYFILYFLEMGAYNSFCNALVHCIHFDSSAGTQEALENEKSSTCLNQDRTLHTNGTARVLQVSKTLDLFFRNKSVKSATEAPHPLSLACMHCEDEVEPKLFR